MSAADGAVKRNTVEWEAMILVLKSDAAAGLGINLNIAACGTSLGGSCHGSSEGSAEGLWSQCT